MSNIKDLFVGFFLSLSKVEKEEVLSQLTQDDENTRQESKIRKEEIKIISPLRFYQILERADNFNRMKYSEKFDKWSSQRQIRNLIYSFTNQRFGTFFEDINSNSATYKFKTSNLLGKVSDSVYITKENMNDTNVLLNFNITLNEDNKNIATKLRFDDLEFFTLNENGKQYYYDNINHIDTIRFDKNTILVTYSAFPLIDGEYPQHIHDQQSTMSKKDLIDPNTFHWKNREIL
jgi:hypothetical protein